MLLWMKETKYSAGLREGLGRRVVMRICDVAESARARGLVSRNELAWKINYHNTVITGLCSITRNQTCGGKIHCTVDTASKSVRIFSPCAIKSVAVYVSFCLMKNARK
jgi:hypothetical protein